MPDSSQSSLTGQREAPRVVVLGASGFLGRHVVGKLRERSIEVVTVARKPGAGFDAAVDLVEAPQREIEDLFRQHHPTAVINCSGAVQGTAEQLMGGNVVAVHNLLSALCRAVPQARLVQLGSSAEYGAPDGEVPMTEETPARPSSPYGYSKLAATQLVLRARAQGVPATVLRIFNVSGPGSPTSTMLGALTAKLRSGDRIVLDSLDGRRDYVDVRDVADAAVRAATSPVDPPAIVNIGRGEAVRTGDWVEQLIEISGTNAVLEVRPDRRLAHKASAAQVSWQCADITPARQHLGWQPAIDLASSLRDTWLSSSAGRTRVTGSCG